MIIRIYRISPVGRYDKTSLEHYTSGEDNAKISPQPKYAWVRFVRIIFHQLNDACIAELFFPRKSMNRKFDALTMYILDPETEPVNNDVMIPELTNIFINYMTKQK